MKHKEEKINKKATVLPAEKGFNDKEGTISAAESTVKAPNERKSQLQRKNNPKGGESQQQEHTEENL